MILKMGHSRVLMRGLSTLLRAVVQGRPRVTRLFTRRPRVTRLFARPPHVTRLFTRHTRVNRSFARHPRVISLFARFKALSAVRIVVLCSTRSDIGGGERLEKKEKTSSGGL